MKWRMKILIMCLACTLSALVLQTILFQDTSSRILTNRVKAETVGSLQNLQNSVYSYLNSMEGNLIKIYEEDSFMDALNADTDIGELKKDFMGLAQEFTAEELVTLSVEEIADRLKKTGGTAFRCESVEVTVDEVDISSSVAIATCGHCFT